MELARALTTRRHKRPEIADPMPLGRAATQRAPRGAPAIRTKISSPVELLSTTNVLSYNAPDIEGTRRVRHVSSSTTLTMSSDSSARSPYSEDSDNLPSLKEDTTDASSLDSSPPSPEPNHLSCYFQAPIDVDTKQGPNKLVKHKKSASSETISPAIPQRAPSHSKRAHVDLARKRSMQQVPQETSDVFPRGLGFHLRSRSREPLRPTSTEQGLAKNVRRSASIASLRDEESTFSTSRGRNSDERKNSFGSIPSLTSSVSSSHSTHSRSGSNSLRHSASHSVLNNGTNVREQPARKSKREAAHNIAQLSLTGENPFGKEIEQLSAVAEEFTGAVRDMAAEEDFRVMARAGLRRFDVGDYLTEIGACYSGPWLDEYQRGDIAVEAGWI